MLTTPFCTAATSFSHPGYPWAQTGTTPVCSVAAHHAMQMQPPVSAVPCVWLVPSVHTTACVGCLIRTSSAAPGGPCRAALLWWLRTCILGTSAAMTPRGGFSHLPQRCFSSGEPSHLSSAALRWIVWSQPGDFFSP